MDISSRLVAPMSPSRTATHAFGAMNPNLVFSEGAWGFSPTKIDRKMESFSPGRFNFPPFRKTVRTNESGSVSGHDSGNPRTGSRTEDSSNGSASGHDFSRAEKTSNNQGALAPETTPLAVLLLGPTGSGKTALSLALAERFRGEIISCDSVAVYRGMDLGTAKPTPDERARIPHHLIDVADPNQPFTAGDYSRQARTTLRKIANRGKLPIVTGGTGLYLRALTEGLFAGPARQEPLRTRLLSKAQKRGSAWLHRLLVRFDTASALRIHANDTPKLIRAIEVCLAARQPMSQVLARDPLTGFRLLRIGLNPPRAALYDRLNQRCAEMFAAGLIAETRALLACYGPVKALDSLGYRQAVAVLLKGVSEKVAIAEAQQGHRNYAKRQLTWFRREPHVHWIEAFGNDPETRRIVTDLVQAHQ
jgi:tRNA dimethylallyltransferase